MDREETGQFRYACLLIALMSCALLLCLRIAWIYFANPQRFPINTIKVIAPFQHVSRKQVEAVMSHYNTEGFFSLAVRQLRHELVDLPWCDIVSIERIWPDVLKITLIEKIPVALWNNHLITQTGELLPVEPDEKTITGLPMLSGPWQQKKEVLHIYQKLSKLLDKYHLNIAAIQLRENQAWEVLLKNGVILRLGKRELMLRLQRFCKAYVRLFADKTDQLTSVDLRYERGMAVHWKDTIKREDHGEKT